MHVGGFQTEKAKKGRSEHFSSENKLQNATVGLFLKPWHRKQTWLRSVPKSTGKGTQINSLLGEAGYIWVEQNASKLSPVTIKSRVDELKGGNAWTKGWRNASSVIHFHTVTMQLVHVLCH